jgi:hypothetical protein
MSLLPKYWFWLQTLVGFLHIEINTNVFKEDQELQTY